MQAATGKAVKIQDVKGIPDQEKVASSGTDVKTKKFQAERFPRDDAVNGRDRQAVRLRSYRLSLFLISSSPFRFRPSPALPRALLV